MAEKNFNKSLGGFLGASVTRDESVKTAVNTARTTRATKTIKSLAGTYEPFVPTFPNDGPKPPTADDEYKIDFKPNILDNYDQYTYHWKLFITPLKHAYEGTVLSRSAQTIIAETGVTELTIDNVEFNGISVPSVLAGTGTQTLIKFDIIEPSGADLLDQMYYESLSLGIGNWLVMPVYIQLDFKARNPDTGESVANGAPQELGALRWVWPLKITNVKANVTHVGTKYEFDAIMYDELAQSNAYFSLQHNVTLRELTKFGDAMSVLEDKLNEDQFTKLDVNYSIPDTYKIVTDPALAGLDLVDPEASKDTSRGGDTIDFGKKTAQYGPGTSVDKIVDSLLATTKQYQETLQSADTSTSTPDDANKAEPMRKFWRIVTESRPISFDRLRQDNAVEITIYIISYDIGLIEANASQTGQTPESEQAEKKRMNEYLNKRILNKKYNYIFTGLNDQIHSFNLNMNFSYAASLSRFDGIYYDSANSDKGAQQQKRAENERQADELITNTIKFSNDAKPGDEAKVDEAIINAQTKIQQLDVSQEKKDEIAMKLKYARPADRRVLIDQRRDAALAENERYAKSLATPTTGNLRFLSDINLDKKTTDAVQDLTRSLGGGKKRPIVFRESSQEINTAFGTDPSSDSGRARTASIFSTALYTSLDASLQVVKMTIKGDPYWLYPRPVEVDANELPYNRKAGIGAIKALKKAHLEHEESVNTFGTDNFIIIRFRTPKIYNDDTGLVEEYKEVETFSGVYRVISIVSKFEKGKFTQELSCILDPLVDLVNFPQFLSDVEVAIRQDDHVEAEIPDTSIKTDRISGSGNQPKGRVETIGDDSVRRVEIIPASNIPTVDVRPRRP